MAVTSLETPAQMAAVGLVGGNITGVFGSGKSEIFLQNGVFKAPKKGRYRVRLWGGGTRSYYHGSNTGYGYGGHGGFSMKTLELEKGQEVPVTVGNYSSYGTAGTTSFGSHFSATGGENTTYNSSDASWDDGTYGRGIGGDINLNGSRGRHTTTSSYTYSRTTIDNAFSYTDFSLSEYDFTEVPTLDHIGTKGQFPGGNGCRGLVVVEY